MNVIAKRRINFFKGRNKINWMVDKVQRISLSCGK